MKVILKIILLRVTKAHHINCITSTIKPLSLACIFHVVLPISDTFLSYVLWMAQCGFSFKDWEEPVI